MAIKEISAIRDVNRRERVMAPPPSAEDEIKEQQFELGSGNYAQDRGKWADRVEMNELMKQVK